MSTRTTIITLARTWLGTPYHHQASVKGVGADCIGLVRGIWRELYGREPQPLPAYTRDWAEAHGRETLIEAARRHLVEIAPTAAQPGDVLVFRWRRNARAKHCAILSALSAGAAGLPLSACGERVGPGEGRGRGSHKQTLIGNASMIHALEGATVSEVSLSPWWHRHLAGAFMFPAVSDPPPGRSPGLAPLRRPSGRPADAAACADDRYGDDFLVGPDGEIVFATHGPALKRRAPDGTITAVLATGCDACTAVARWKGRDGSPALIVLTTGNFSLGGKDPARVLRLPYPVAP